MSSGPPARYEKPRSGRSRGREETPRSYRTPSSAWGSRSTPTTRRTPAPSNASACPPEPTVRSITVCASDNSSTTSATRTGSCSPSAKEADCDEPHADVGRGHRGHQAQQEQGLTDLPSERSHVLLLSYR